MSNLAAREPRLSKSIVPVNALKDQASTALYFEYLQGRTIINATGSSVRLTAVQLFAVDRHLLTKTHTAVITDPAKLGISGANLMIGSYSAQWRDSSRSGLSFELSPQDAFLTVLEAWEYATHREQYSRDPHPEDVESITAVTAVASEPLMYPVGADLTESLRSDPTNVSAARKLARESELLWDALAIADNHVAIPAKDIVGVPSDSALAGFAHDICMADTAKPYTPPRADRPAPVTIHPDLIELAHGTRAWS